jgi:hypothetical protein
MSIHTVGELIEYLEQYDDKTEVAVAYQPSYPLRGVINNVVSNRELVDVTESDEDEVNADEEIVWIAVNGTSEYGPRGVWQ